MDSIAWRFEDGIGENRDAAGFDGFNHVGLLRRRRVGVDDADAAEGGHGNGHVGLGDGVHGGRNAGDREGDAAAESGGQMDGVGGEVDVVRKEDDVIVGVGVALVEEPIGGEAVFED